MIGTRRAFGAAHQLGKLEAVHRRHADVDQGERDLMLEQQLERFLAARRLQQLDTRLLEERREHVQVVGAVVDDEQAHFFRG